MDFDTDTELDESFDEDAEAFETDSDDLEFDFDHLTPPDGAYLVKIVSVAFRNGPGKKNPSRNSIGLNVTLKIDEEDSDFNGELLNDYLWLGEDSFNKQGQRRVKALVEACGLEDEVGSTPKTSAFLPETQLIGGKAERVWTLFSGLTVGVSIATKTEEVDGVERENTRVKAYMTPEAVASLREGDSDSY